MTRFFASITFTTDFRYYVGFCGRVTPAEAMSLVCSSALVLVWIVTGHWVLMDGKLFALNKGNNVCSMHRPKAVH